MKSLDRFRALSQVHQIAAIVALVAICSALIGAGWFFFLQTPYQPLFTGLKPVDAATIVAELDRKKVPYRLSEGGAVILVPQDRVDATRLSIMTEELPLKGTVGFELFNKADMGLTDFAQKINYQRALQGELERTIMSLDGVASARVHVSLGEDRLFRDDQVPPKASVTVRMAKGLDLDTRTVLGIQRLISAAVSRLETANVVVLNEEGRVMGNSPVVRDPGVTVGVPEEHRAIEEFYEARVRQVMVPDVKGNVTVRVVALIGSNQTLDPHGFLVWNPSARDFPLQVTVTTAEKLTTDAQDRLRAGVALIIGNVAGDSLAFVVDASSQYNTSLPPDSSEKAKPKIWQASDPAASNSLTIAELLFVFVPIGLIGCFVIILRQIRRPRILNSQQRLELAGRLRDALHGETNAAS